MFAATLSEARRAKFGDTFVVVTAEGEVLTAADAAMHLLAGIGGLWLLLSRAMGLIHRRLCNRAYHLVGDRRYRIFGMKADLFPLIPPEMKGRVLL